MYAFYSNLFCDFRFFKFLFLSFSDGQYQYPISGSEVYKNPSKYFNCSTPIIFVMTGYTSDKGQDSLYVATKPGLKKTPNTKINFRKFYLFFRYKKVSLGWGTKQRLRLYYSCVELGNLRSVILSISEHCLYYRSKNGQHDCRHFK